VSPFVRTAWELTREISPRLRVRVAAVDAYGSITNEFPGRGAPIEGDCPTSTWAMMLADDAGLYRFMCFDLDAKHGRPQIDAGTLGVWLYDLGIPHLVTESGPSGGRHVWIALEEGVEPHLVHQVGQLAKRLLPTLDLSQFNNVRTGAVRPPGAPHRSGGHSRVLEGHVGLLRHPTVAVGDVVRLREHLLELVGPLTPPLQRRQVRFVELDPTNLPHITTAGSRVSLKPAPAGGDASAVLASAIARYVHAGWTFDQVLAIAPTSPAFTHAYTERTADGSRRPRSVQRAHRILERQWQRVTTWVQDTPDAFSAQDPEFETRAAAAVALVDAIQDRANASPGRWARNGAGSTQSAGTGRFSDRLTLDALCYLALQAVSGAVEASTRTLSALTGLGRETARTALLQLQEDGWVSLDTPADGVRAAKWRLPSLSTGRTDENRSQVFPPPGPPTGARLRDLRLTDLSAHLQAHAHDVFSAPHSLGRSAARVYAALPPDELLDLAEISHASALSARTARLHLRRLAANNLAIPASGMWQRAPDNRDQVAENLGVAGYLERRRERYGQEREAWAWWQSELEHRRAPRGRRRRRRHATQLGLMPLAGSPPDFPIHPRRRDGRADFAAALAAVRAGVLADELKTSEGAAKAA
jgi:hypothetical protein